MNVLNGLNSESVDLVYLDPPFNSKRLYNAPIGSRAEGSQFKDTWNLSDVNEQLLDIMSNNFPELVDYIDIIDRVSDIHMKSYITYMAQRVIQLHRILKPTGSIYYHCDPTAGHFVKLMLDCVFGKENFRNEIVWQRNNAAKGSQHNSKRFGVDTDCIFFIVHIVGANILLVVLLVVRGGIALHVDMCHDDGLFLILLDGD